jgi:hypothetical protein
MPSDRGGLTFDQILPRLLVAYDAGRLVPFIGVGMSRPNCADWRGLVAGLESGASILDEPLSGDTRPEDLIRRANRAVQSLRASAAGRFEEALRAALFVGSASPPPQTQALARIWWPLVLTTNYDDFYVEAFHEAFGSHLLGVVGRGSEDCQRVLTSLRVAGRAILWALQGHLAAPCRVAGHEDDRRLASELVIDHAEYRRVTYREPHFRRAFGEVFRDRSFLFLGSGLREAYLQELFGEIIELHGPSARGHYAIMPRGEVDPGFMAARFQITVVEYPERPGDIDHRFVPACLETLRAAIERSEAAAVSWSWGSSDDRGSVVQSRPDLEIARGPLPMTGDEHECLVVSAGGRLDQDVFHVSDALQPTLARWCGRDQEHDVSWMRRPAVRSPYVGEYEHARAFAVRARAEHDDVKDLLSVRDASRALFEAVGTRYRTIRMQLLASGGDERGDGRRWSIRPFPARFALVETVRAWGEWRRDHPDADVRLVLHVVDASVLRALAGGRIDVLELLRCRDVAFWAEVVQNRSLLERRRFELDESTSLGAVAAELCLDPAHWSVDVSPPTDIDAQAGDRRLDGSRDEGPLLACSLRELGVVPGSTLHFRRVDATAVPRATTP